MPRVGYLPKRRAREGHHRHSQQRYAKQAELGTNQVAMNEGLVQPTAMTLTVGGLHSEGRMLSKSSRTRNFTQRVNPRLSQILCPMDKGTPIISRGSLGLGEVGIHREGQKGTFWGDDGMWLETLIWVVTPRYPKSSPLST